MIGDGASVYCATTTRQWHTKQGVNLFGDWPGNNPNLILIELLWSQMKQLQKNDCTMTAAGLKKVALKLWE